MITAECLGWVIALMIMQTIKINIQKRSVGIVEGEHEISPSRLSLMCLWDSLWLKCLVADWKDGQIFREKVKAIDEHMKLLLLQNHLASLECFSLSVLEFLEGTLWLFNISYFNVNVSIRNTTLIVLSTAFLFYSKSFLYLIEEYLLVFLFLFQNTLHRLFPKLSHRKFVWLP